MSLLEEVAPQAKVREFFAQRYRKGESTGYLDVRYLRHGGLLKAKRSFYLRWSGGKGDKLYQDYSGREFWKPTGAGSPLLSSLERHPR